ncbi:MAG: DNA translocase FtsK 4TM domain-containing protein [Heliobacteriaceae bacterium]|nr:DNA translocase FtsK 4TM domain-containing protein [Heliobacteriaceae bacterium]
MFEKLKEDLKYELAGLLVLVIAALCLVSLFTVNNNPLAVPSAGAGAVGQFLATILGVVAGQGKIIIPIFLIYFGVKIMTRRVAVFDKNVAGFLFGFCLCLIFFHLRLPVGRSDWQAALDGDGGGIVGAVFSIVLKTLFGTMGTYVVLTAGALAAVLFVFDLSLVALCRSLFRRLGNGYNRCRGTLSNFLFTVVEEEEPVPQSSRRKRSRQRKEKPGNKVENKAEFAPEPDLPLVIIDHAEKELPDWLREPARVAPLPEVDGESGEAAAPGSQAGGSEPGEPMENRLEDTLVEAKDAVPVVGANSSGQQPAGGEEYTLPPLSLLNRSLRVKSTRMNQDITENVRILEETLESFGVKVKVVQVNRGPVITRYEVQPAPGVKVARITSLADDIALSLAAGSVRIEVPIPGKAAVGIEVPNKEVTAVTFREVLEVPEFQQSAAKLTIALGKDIAGTPIVSELSRMPHLLIAGATGAGKSVCMNSLICSILFKAKPSEVKFLMVDPKMVELTQYNGIPHLIIPVVTDAKKAAIALKWAVNEMESRYELFAAAGVKDIVRYNQLKGQENPDLAQPALPYVVILIDELADLMMVAAVDVEDAICRLAQMARAAGIHLVVATQRPSVDVITGIIKANIPSRIAFAVSSQTDSRTILDQAGAEKLLGRGDMLFYPVGANKPLRLQGCYVSDKEVEDLVNFLKTQGMPEYQEGIIPAGDPVEKPVVEDDELFVEAVKVLVDSGQASISMLQRRLRIGYARAARLIDIMEQRGIVGGYEGSRPREILINQAQFEARYGSPGKTGS